MPLTAGSNRTLQRRHSGQVTVPFCMPCTVTSCLSKVMMCTVSDLPAAPHEMQHEVHLELVHNDRVIVLAVIRPGLCRPLLIRLPSVLLALHAIQSNAKVYSTRSC